MWSAFLAIAAQSSAGTVDFCADRPGLATGTCIVEAGDLQLESSLVDWSVSKSDGEKETDWLFGASRLRIGLSSQADLQLAFAPYLRIRFHGDDDEDVSGVSDLVVAVKYRIVDRPDFSLAVLPAVKIPVAKEPVGNGKVEAGVTVPMEIGLPNPFSLTLTPEVDFSSDASGSGHHFRTVMAASLGLDVGDRWSVALDGLWARERDEGTSHEGAIGFSATRLVGSKVQFDVEFDRGISHDIADWRTATGFAVRF